MKQKIALLAATGLMMLISCQNKEEGNVASPTPHQKSDTLSSSKADIPKEITLTPAGESQAFAHASLKETLPADGKKIPPGLVKFDFKLENFELGMQTPDAGNKGCNNSDKGQHIHHILNNEPYTAYYETAWEKELPEGSYTSLAFLARSYHESIKNASAWQIRQFTVGNAKPQFIDLKAPHLFYSRPKGDYIGEKNTQKILLDFYLLNSVLAPEANKVKATINGKDFIIDRWQPYFIEGLPLGENTIALTLLDKNGAPIPGPYNQVQRKINLFKDEPILK